MYLLESPRRGDSNKYTERMFFLKHNMGISMKKYTIRYFCADQFDVITNFALITNVIAERVHCTCINLPAVVFTFFSVDNISLLESRFKSFVNINP